MTEEWKPIEGFEGIYEVSNLGRVKSLKRITDEIHHIPCKILKPTTNKDGYVRVGMRKNKKQFSKTVHRLVAEAFIPNPNNLPEVNHLDGNKQNNRAENLSWCTAKQNQKHSLEMGLRRASELNGGGVIHVTKEVNDKINKIVQETGLAKWEVTNKLLLKSLESSGGKLQ